MLYVPPASQVFLYYDLNKLDWDYQVGDIDTPSDVSLKGSVSFKHKCDRRMESKYYTSKLLIALNVSVSCKFVSRLESIRNILVTFM